MPTTNNMLPPGWAKTTIGAICQFTGGGTPSKDRADYWNGDIPWASVKDVKGMFIHETQDYITEQGLKNSASQLAKTGELIIVTRISPGESAIAAIDIAINQDLKIAKPFYPAQSTFLHYLFKAYKEEIANQARGTTVLGIRLHELSSLSINLPPLNEQNRIAAKIEALFTEIDQGIESIKLAQRQLKTYRQSILKHAFEGKLTEQWQEAHADEMEDLDRLLTRIKTEREVKHNRNSKELPPLTAGEIADLPEISRNWKWVKLAVIATNIQIGPFGSLLHKSDYIENGTPLINPSHIKEQRITPDYSLSISPEKMDEMGNFIMHTDDIVIGRRGEMGRCAVVTEKEDGWLCGTGSLFISLSSNSNPFFYSYILSSRRVKDYLTDSSVGTTMMNLNQKILHNIPVPLCSLAEQQEIVREIEARFTEIDQLEKTLQASLQQAESLRQSILKAAFAGKLVEQDPADEPAEVLLNVIKSGKS